MKKILIFSLLLVGINNAMDKYLTSPKVKKIAATLCYEQASDGTVRFLLARIPKTDCHGFTTPLYGFTKESKKTGHLAENLLGSGPSMYKGEQVHLKVYGEASDISQPSSSKYVWIRADDLRDVAGAGIPYFETAVGGQRITITGRLISVLRRGLLDQFIKEHTKKTKPDSKRQRTK